MSSTDADLRALGIAGSLRRGSFNRALIRAALDQRRSRGAGRPGTARSQLQLRQTLQSTRSPTMPGPEVLVAQAHELVNEDGALTDGKTRRYVAKLLEALAEWVPRF